MYRSDPQRERKVASGEPPEEGLMWVSSLTIASSGGTQSSKRDRCALEITLPGRLSSTLCFLPPLVHTGCGAEPWES